MLEKVKLTLRITTSTFDSEIEDLIAAAKADLALVGVEADDDEPLVARAISTYCRVNFGEPDDYERMKKSYDEQKAQLKSSTEYRGE